MIGEFFRQLREFLATAGVAASYTALGGVVKVEAGGVGLESAMPEEMYSEDGSLMGPAEIAEILSRVESIVESHNASL